jgi:6-phosphogluconolactonase
MLKFKKTLITLLKATIPVIIMMGLSTCRPDVPDESPGNVLLSTFNEGRNKGFVLFGLDKDSLNPTIIQRLGKQPEPSYFEFHPSGKFLYMVSPDPAGKGLEGGSLNAYVLDRKEEKIKFINAVPTYGEGPCHVSFDRKGRTAFVSSYGSGSLSVFPVLATGGVGDTLQFIQFEGSSLIPERQDAPHAHSALMSRDNRRLYVADLGTDKIMVYDFEAETGLLTPAEEPWISCPAGAGPRHMVLHYRLDVLYVAEELSSSISVFKTGDIPEDDTRVIQRIPTLPTEYRDENSVADIHISPGGKHLYVSNRGHNSIAVFSIDQEDGSLSPIEFQSSLGNWPRSFNLSYYADLMAVANRKTDNIILLSRDSSTGMLEETGLEISVKDPKCIKFYY